MSVVNDTFNPSNPSGVYIYMSPALTLSNPFPEEEGSKHSIELY